MQKLYRATAYKAVYSVCLANGVTLLHSISVYSFIYNIKAVDV